MFVIDKPGSIQVHPSGRYRHNTVLHIMRKELGYDRLFRECVVTYPYLTHYLRHDSIKSAG